ncbi:MAG: TatD family hydrolase [Nitrososphaerota archaeon]|nr:TatD family hydrolase [Nitrososphaerota archaeon]MDG7022906.1 TatD family hydrolase [Nitrososphaerota archaeon]
MRFVDSHLHLTEQDLPALMPLSLSNHTFLVTCGIDRETSQEALKLAERYPGKVAAFVGIHPSEAAKSEAGGWLQNALAGAAGLGEVGLDPTYSQVSPEGAQMKAFLAELELAEKMRKPVQVHSRDAETQVLEVLGRFGLPAVLMHWLESEEALPRALERGYFVSYGPALLYSKKLQRMAMKSPPSQVLAETDFPVPYRPLGAKGPSLVPSVVFRLAEVWGVRFDEAREIVLENTLRYLRLPEKG